LPFEACIICFRRHRVARRLVAIGIELGAGSFMILDDYGCVFHPSGNPSGGREFMSLNMLRDAIRKGRSALRRAIPDLRRRMRSSVPGRFQPYNHTLPDRYPWLFQFASTHLGNGDGLRLLSFGCSRGEEVFTLRSYFPTAAIKGIDIDSDNIARCLARARAAKSVGMTFVTAATTEGELSEAYDAIFCLAVLCLGDLTNSGAERCDPLLRFDDFERMIVDFSRCLKPGGLLLLHTANFRFCDTVAAQEFDAILEAETAQLAPDVLFDRGNRLMKNVRYHSVAFRKRGSAAPKATYR
jgi:SAM-dependent methyltransferase